MNRVALTALLPLLWGAPQVGHAAACMAGMVMPGCTPVPAATPKRVAKPPPNAPSQKMQEPARAPARPGATCMAGMVMPGCTPAPKSSAAAPSAADPHAGHAMPPAPAAPAATDAHAGHQMGPPASPADPHAGHVMSAEPPPPAATDPHAGHAMGPGETGADLPVGDATPPAVIRDNVADRVYDPGAMQQARSVLEEEHGGARVSKLQADLLEWAPKGDRYGWQVEGWYGGDINRFAFKTEGEGRSGEGVEAAEVQFLYSRAVARYADVQAGLRYDLEPHGRAYATVGVDALFPYWFEAEGALFLSDKGDLLARVEGSYDFRLIQRLVLQPRTELEFAAQDIPESRIGSGLSRGEFGLRLRYEIRREFAPYVGVSYERSFGETADFVRAHGESAGSTRFVVGLRAWF